MAYLTSFALLFLVFQIIINPQFLYVKETPGEEEENESTVGTVLPTKGKPQDSEGEENYHGIKIWL